MKMRRYAVWSEKDCERLKLLVESGASAMRVSVVLKRSLASTKGKARDLGCPFPGVRDQRKQIRRILENNF